MSTPEEVLELATQRYQTALKNFGGSSTHSAVDEFLQASFLIGPLDQYKILPPPCHRIAADSSEREGKGGSGRAFLQLLVWHAIADSIQSRRFSRLPARVQKHQLVQFSRMLQHEAVPDGWSSLESDIFLKDFGLASLRLYAAAAQLIDLRCGLARSILLRSGFRGLGKGLRMLMDCGGFQPMLQIHTHTAYLDEFNEAGWEECYRTCADIYAANPGILGMFGGSWFYDPQLREISPRLAYLMDTPCRAGAHLLLTDTEGDFVQDAISTSPSRRKLFETGEYKPCRYTLVWGKRRQTQWAIEHAL